MKKIIFLFIYMLASSIVVKSQSITAEKIADIRNVTEAVLSPDAQTVGYIVRVPGEDYTGMQKSALMTVPVNGKKQN